MYCTVFPRGQPFFFIEKCVGPAPKGVCKVKKKFEETLVLTFEAIVQPDSINFFHFLPMHLILMLMHYNVHLRQFEKFP